VGRFRQGQGRGLSFAARERIARLLDDASFVELDAFAVHRSDAFGLGDKKFVGDGGRSSNTSRHDAPGII